ncbi:MAG: nucleotidyltransferase domain-containing protein [Bacteroidota bacterium]
MIEHIKTTLRKIEAQREIKILYAIESGSRAWGFASPDSDWDARFIYIHKPEWYLSIDTYKDSMEIMLEDGDLDFSGWELRKALKLFRKSNPPLMEWLQSPIVYIQDDAFINRLRELAIDFFNPKSCLYHYLNMGRNNLSTNFKKEEFKLKKYFYVLRPILACDWIDKYGEMAPILFDTLLELLAENQPLKAAIDDLLIQKKAAGEMATGPRIKVIDDFVNARIDFHTEKLKAFKWEQEPDTELLNIFFRAQLNAAW